MNASLFGRIGLLAALTLAVASGCRGGGELPLLADGFLLDLPTDTDAVETDQPSADPGTTDGDASSETIAPGTVTFFFQTATGPKGEDQSDVSLVLADEPVTYVATPGFQMDIVIKAENVDPGTEVRLLVAGNQVATGTFADIGNAQVGILFPTVTLTHDKNGYEVSVITTDHGGQEVSATKLVRVDIGTCGVSLLPKNTECLLGDMDTTTPGVQVVFTISNPDRTCDQARVDVIIGDRTVSSGLLVLMDTGAASVELTLFDADVVVDGVAMTVTAGVSDSTATDRTAGLPDLVYVMDLVDPTIVITAPEKPVLSRMDDLDGDLSNGITIDVEGSAVGIAPSSEVTFLINQTEQETLVPGESGSFRFAGVNLGTDGQYVLTVTGTDACGRVGKGEVSVVARVSEASYVIVTPTQGGTLLAKDDDNPATTMSFETTFEVLATSIEVGSTLTVHCREDRFGAPELTVGTLVITTESEDDLYFIDVVLNVTALTRKIACYVIDNAANPATSGEVAFTVALPPPMLRIQRPAAGSMITSSPMSVLVAETGLDGITPTVVVQSGTTPVVTYAATPFGIGGSTYGVPLANGGVPISDGAYTLVVDATDAQGNKASDIAGNVTRVDFIKDTMAPTLAITTPTDNNIPPPPDEDSATPGYQITFVVTVSSGGGDGTRVCLTLHGSERCQTLVGGAGSATFTGITLIAGNNVATARAVDLANNEGFAPTRTFLLTLDAPRVIIAEPAHDGPVAALPVTLKVQVRNATGTLPLPDATVVLKRNGVPEGSPVITDGIGEASFSITALSQTGDVFTAEATKPPFPSPGVSPPRTLRFKAEIPALAFTQPLDGQSVNLAYSACAPGIRNCVLNVKLAATNFENGSTGGLTVQCGASTTVFAATVSNSVLTFESVTLIDQASCVLTATATDLADTAKTAGPITVNVDRVAPVIAAFVRPAAGVDALTDMWDENTSLPGMQFTIVARVGGAEAGQVLRLVYGLVGEETEEVSVPLPSNVPDSSTLDVTLPQITMPNGNVLMTLTLSDAAGNPTQTSRSILVWMGTPVVRIMAPSNVLPTACTTHATCGSGGYCADGTCMIPWSSTSSRSLLVSLVEFPASQNNLRVCSNQAGLSGTACTTAGYRQVALVTAPTVGFQTVSVNALPDGVHTLIAEGKVSATEPWVSSLLSPNAPERQRNVFQDTVPPQVTQLTSPSDTLPPSGTLNILEQTEAGKVYSFQVAATEAGSLALFVNGPQKATVPDFSGSATVTATLDEGANVVQAEAHDGVGNVSTRASLNVTVDTLPPGLSFVNPIGTVLKGADSRDVILSSDAVGQILTLAEQVGDLWVDQASGAVGSNQRITFPYATTPVLDDGTHTIRASLSDAAGNAASLARTIQVDKTPPQLTVIAPTDPSTLTDGDDASIAGGYQVLVRFSSSSEDSVSWALRLESECDALFTACAAPITIASGGLTPDVEVVQTPTLSLGTSNYYRLTIQVFDQIGNVTSSVRRLTLNLAQCWVSLSGIEPGGFINNTSCAISGTNCASVAQVLTATLAAGCTSITSVKLYVGGSEVQSKSPSGQTAVFDAVTFNDGLVTTIEARAFAGIIESGSTGTLQLIVDLTDPLVSLTGPGTGSPRKWGVATDLFSGEPGLQVDLTVSATDVHLLGGQLVSLTYDTGLGGQALPLANPSLPFVFGLAPVTLQTVTLPDQTAGTIQVSVADAAGNTTTQELDVVVDIQPPAAITFGSVSTDDINRRRPMVRLKWRAVGDNDDQSGTRASTYDLRFSKFPITQGNFESACRVEDLVNTPPLPTPAIQGTFETLTVTGPDPRPSSNPCKFLMGVNSEGTYYFAARVADDVGNFSPIEAGSVKQVDLGLRTATISGTAGWTDGGLDLQKRVYGVGDVNGDGFADIGLGGGILSKFCIVYGRTEDPDTGLDLVLDSPSGPHHGCLSGASSSLFGTPLASLQDVNGDGVDDLAVGEGFGTASPYKVSVFLGRQGSFLASQPNLVITGMNNLVGGVAVAGGGDFDGDGLNDILIGSRGEDRAYLIPGNNAWNALTNITIDLQQESDRIVHRVVTFAMGDAITSPPEQATNFGINVSFVKDLGGALPDVLDGRDEVAIGTDTSPNQVVLLRGREVVDTITVTVSRENLGTFDDASAVRVFPDTGTRLFGAAGLDGLMDLDADGRGDLLVGHYKAAAGKTVYAFYGSYLKSRFGQSAILSATTPIGDNTVWRHPTEHRGFAVTGSFDHPVALGNFDDDPALVASDDIGYVIYSTMSTYGSVFIRLNVNDPTDGYGTFPYPAPTLVDPNDSDGTRFGSYSAINANDVNHDGYPDLLVGTNGSGYVIMFY